MDWIEMELVKRTAFKMKRLPEQDSSRQGAGTFDTECQKCFCVYFRFTFGESNKAGAVGAKRLVSRRNKAVGKDDQRDVRKRICKP